MTTNHDGWESTTVLTPGSWAMADEMDSVIRALFSEDSVTNYQRRVGEAALREAVGELRADFAKAVEQRGGVPKDVMQLVEGLLALLDPDHEKFNGYYPSGLVCPFHQQPPGAASGSMRPAFAKCPGYPRCRTRTRAEAQ